jgi:hypothetical protein
MRAIVKILLLLFVIVFVSTACTIPFGPRLVKGSGDIVVEERDVSDFEEILVTGAGRFIITQGDSESLTIETDDNLMEYIETDVKGKTLEIGFKDGTVFSSQGGRKALEPSDGFIFRISVIDLTNITISGAAKIDVEKLKTDNLNIVLSGAGDINLDDLNAHNLDVLLSGAGDIMVVGAVDTQNVSLNGFGRYQGFDLKSQEAVVTISGAGGAEVWVSDSLEVVISGAGDVKYYGSPEINPEISGLGRIQSLGEK